MENQQARDELFAELKRHGLPPAYIQRLLEELDDHLADMEEERSRKMNGARKPESTNTEVQKPDVISLHQQLGDPSQLAALAAKQYHNRSFLGRHPVLTFLVLPLPLIIAGMWIVALSAFLISNLTSPLIGVFVPSGYEVYDHPFVEYITGTFLFWLIIILPTIGTALFLCRIARRNRLASMWQWAMCAIVAAFCGNLYITWQMSPLNERMQHCRMAFGLCIPFLAPYPKAFWYEHFLPQFTGAMLFGLLLIKRAQRLQAIRETQQERPLLRQAA